MQNLFSKKVPMLALFLLIFQLTAMAANKTTTESFWQNGPQMLMMLSILILLVVIIVVGKIIIALVGKDTQEIWKKIKAGRKAGMVLVLGLLSQNLLAADTVAQPAAAATSTMIFGMDATLFWVMLTVLIFEFIVLMMLSYTLYMFLVSKGLVAPGKNRLPKWLQFHALMGNDIPLEKDAELLTDHDYDGIQELDNGMPPILKYIFVVTIIAAAAYWIHYHVLETGPLMLEEYQTELKKAAISKEEYLKKAGNLIDENTVKLMSDAGALATGEKIYTLNCVACHGDKGQGGVGPNFTDSYWLHGGDIQSVFKVVKYGVPDKGMRSWQSEIKPGDIQAVSSFILSKFGGTNVAGGKAPQGVLFAAGNTAAVDSGATGTTATAKDSLKP